MKEAAIIARYERRVKVKRIFRAFREAVKGFKEIEETKVREFWNRNTASKFFGIWLTQSQQNLEQRAIRKLTKMTSSRLLSKAFTSLLLYIQHR